MAGEEASQSAVPRRLAPRNTGVVTFLNNNQTRSLQEVARTLAHEVRTRGRSRWRRAA